MVNRIKTAEQFIHILPHAKALGMRLESLSNGTAVMTMPYAPELIGDPATGVIHGGAVSALLDTSCGAAVMSHPRCPARTATIDLRVEYLRSAVPGQQITTRATCYHVTRSVAFVRAEATDEDQKGPVAMATGTFTIEAGQ
ncbi:MAG: PaaI family thioesterase [Pseudomonadota bacterium]